MKRTKVREILSKFVNGGNAYLVFEHLSEKKVKELKITQSDLAKELNKTRPSIQSSLELLSEVGLIKFSYGKIIIIQEIT